MPLRTDHTPGGPALIKRLNRVAIVRLVKRRPGISRSEVVERSGLTKSTISVLVQELLEEGWLCEGASVARSQVGRRRTPLSLDGRRLGLLGVELGPEGLQVVGCNLLGEIVDARSAAHARPGPDPAAAARAVARLASGAQEAMRRRGYRLLGLAVAVPGVVAPGGALVRFAPGLGWRNVPLGALLQAALEGRAWRGVPVSVLNDARAAAFSQYVFGEEPRAEPLVYLRLGTTVGAGIVVGGQLQAGHSGLAGQVGHIILERGGRPCACGRRGCAETLVSQAAISRRITGGDGPVLPIPEIAARLARGDPAAVEALARAGHHLGVLLLAIGSALDPAEVVLGGPLAQLGDPFVATAVEAMRAELGRFDRDEVAVRICRYGQHACALGAAGSILQGAVTV